MSLLNLNDVTISYGQPPLIDGISLSIERGERVCLIGRNGAGKSTLLKVIVGQIQPDDGVRKVEEGLVVAQLEQQVPIGLTGSVFDVIAAGLGEQGELLKRYHTLTHAMAEGDFSDATMAALERCQSALDDCDGWDTNQRVESIITKMELDAEADIDALSGGYKRRVLLARALVRNPDLLLLDEPTNHLDIEAIGWIEQFLLNWHGSLLFISHDRQFMENLATRFIEIDRGQLRQFDCNYATYLVRKEEQLETEAKQQALFDKRLSEEERWIRQGIKARRTRNEGRVRALEEMRREHAERRKVTGSAKMAIQDGSRSGKLVSEVNDITIKFGDKVIADGFSTLIQRGDKIGLIGRNGVGKTTLLKAILGELTPSSGSVRTGHNLQIAYFDQYRAALDEERSVQDSVADGRDMLDIGGKQRHVISYLQDFLFDPKRCRQPVSALSGGERNRLLLAKLFAQPSNLLVLDEPTNDLDIDTLDLLEELLINYPGTLLLVSHDRAFINNVVTSSIVFEGTAEQPGLINEYVGGYDDWLRQRDYASAATAVPTEKKKPAATAAAAQTKPTKRSYKEQRELDSLPQEIEQAETLIEQLGETMSSSDFYQQPREKIAEVEAQLSAAQAKLEGLFQRWSELEP